MHHREGAAPRCGLQSDSSVRRLRSPSRCPLRRSARITHLPPHSMRIARSTLQGTVTKVELVNPHAWIWLDVKGADGKAVNWGIEGGPPTNLLRSGITKFTLPVGTVIKVFGYQAKSGEPKGVGVFVEYLNGRKVFMGGSAPGATGVPSGN